MSKPLKKARNIQKALELMGCESNGSFVHSAAADVCVRNAEIATLMGRGWR